MNRCQVWRSAHWEVLPASDFPTAEVWTTRGLVTDYLLFVTTLAHRVMDIVGMRRECYGY